MSRIAMMARPCLERLKFMMTSMVSRTSRMAYGSRSFELRRMEEVSMPSAPCRGVPLMFRLVRTFLMISPQPSVTMAR